VPAAAPAPPAVPNVFAGAVGAIRRSAPSWCGALVALIGLIDVLSAVTPPERARFDAVTDMLTLGVADAAAAVAAVVGVLLIVLARGLRRGQRRAWVATVGLLSVSVLLHLAKGLDVEEAVLTLGLLGIMISVRDQFDARSDAAGPRSAPLALLLLLIVDFVAGSALVYLRWDGPHALQPTLREVAYGLVGVAGPLKPASGRDAAAVSAILLGLGVLTVVLPTVLLLRPATRRAVATAADLARLRALLARHGDDSLGYFALRDDKSVVWSPSSKSGVTFRVVSGIALASGDPLGDPEAWPGAIESFLNEARQQAWVPAVLGCGERAAVTYSRAGMRALELGDEAVVDVPTFSLEGRSMRSVRQAIHRIERAGYVARVDRAGDLDLDELTELMDAASNWREGHVERGFSMALGRLGRADDRECVVVRTYQEGRLRGFLHFVPWGPDGLSLDKMRRDRTADNGVNEFLIVTMLRAAEKLGVCRVSLNFAMFRSALERGGRIGAGPVSRLWRRILLVGSRWWQIESLYRFNDKFGPQWRPRYVCYRRASDLPRIGLAALEAERFLTLPSVPRRTPAGNRDRATSR
jgi:lysyl-tRNA synthetase, class II